MTNTLAKIRLVNLTLTAIGAAVFLALFAYISLAPKDFDQRTRHFAIAKVKDKVNLKLDKAANSKAAQKVGDIAGIFSRKLEKKIDALRAKLDGGAAELIADVLAAACKLDCKRRDAAAKAIAKIFESSIDRHRRALDRVRALIVGQYDKIMGKLRQDLKIFSGTSFLALLFAMLLSIFHGKAAAHLLPFSIILTTTTLLAATWYVFGQDWVMTIIYSDYWGWAYPAFMSIITVFLADIALNRARITTHVVNWFGSIADASFELVPC